MTKSEVLTEIKEAGIVAVIRGESKEEAYQTAVACIKGGVKAIELTFTVPEVDNVISSLKNEYSNDLEVMIGAGTVLDVFTARIAIMSGAKFIVSPSFDQDTALLCNEYQVPYMPGCMTVTEVQTAMKYGAEIVKAFPGDVLGKAFIKSIKAPLPQANIMPTGGVNLENMHEWFDAGAVAVGAGSNLTGDATTGDFEEVTKKAAAYYNERLRLKNNIK
ncbi:bifunctional 4-hydroxy-2-oxoglutarate aldolase/2-dehydro-3-deoxy-phosphogluconate aldolase [Tetragenococcus halophilus]|uniref:bifunctional 4-hydroxy-2-oxoglutarate aldolase/2-dehydro-3-deoxy-phosphogluconate aldolase n=1 Tax=Tetragenococcus halophilus TaxID=51669 RepID=UPI0021BA4438|nr:bifunctional 4-hydroxy-2-oxoglutarate aldolase/2-dehydro-3-deoxy-phosphogluconate aldolase [Tetragenococcus halophilus]MCT8311237.1 bifunctional 4-hydroxy-2-oxoglutarate aldolase/2-dehydro-3-deoxy-phosphogluconate aldolase [Tetragenococcus halophilus]